MLSAHRRPLFTILSSSVRTLFIPRQTELWTHVSLIRTAFATLPTIHHTTFHLSRLAFAALPTIHHVTFHIGRHTFAPLPTRIVEPRSPVRTAFAHRRPLFTILSPLIRTLFIPCRPELWTHVSLIRTACAVRPTIHHLTFHLGRLALAPLPTRIVGPRYQSVRHSLTVGHFSQFFPL